MLIFFIILTAVAVFSPAYADDPELAALFREKGINGALVISSMDGRQNYSSNEVRANTRFLPASTFKIVNTLIALEEGAVSDEKQIIKWDGKDMGVASWNRDQSVETAFPASCIWFYQELAQRVGDNKYRMYLDKTGYGNRQTGPDVRTFWLTGDIAISAVEQISFLKKVYTKEYPFRPTSYNILKKIMIVEQTPAYTIRAKTGWVQKAGSTDIGWYTGYVEAGDKVWFFAMNMDIIKPDDRRFRQEITMEALRRKGIIGKSE